MQKDLDVFGKRFVRLLCALRWPGLAAESVVTSSSLFVFRGGGREDESAEDTLSFAHKTTHFIRALPVKSLQVTVQ